jgi:hypothetical protein
MGVERLHLGQVHATVVTKPVKEMLKMEPSSSFLPTFLQKKPVISVLSVVMIVLTLGVSVAFTRLYSAHAANVATWPTEANLIRQKSSRSPAMTAFNGKLYVAYVAPDPDFIDKVYVTSSSDGPAWPVDGTLVRSDITISSSIAMAVYNNKLYLAYVAGDGSNALMTTSSSDGTTWSAATPVPNQYSNATPSLAVYNNKLYVAFVADNSSSTLLIASYDGTTWSGESQVGSPSVTQSSGYPPALAVYNNRLYLVFVSANKNRDVLYVSYDGTRWSNDIRTGQVSQDAPAITVYNNELSLAFADNGNNDHLLYVSSDGSSWPNSIWISGQYTKQAPAITVFNGRLYIAFVSNNSDDLLIISGS